MWNLEWQAFSNERSSRWRSFQTEVPPAKEKRRFLIAKRTRGTNSSPLAAAERSARRAAQNQH